MNSSVKELLAYINENNGIGDKSKLIKKVVSKFSLTKDRSIYYSPFFAIRFSQSATSGFSNTVLSLSNLQKYDELPFIVCLVKPTENVCFLANTTFLAKISHSSQQLRENNIRGSFNGSDIMKTVIEIENKPENFAKLFAIHTEIGFAGNLARLVEATNDIVPSGTKFSVTSANKQIILESVERANRFISSKDYLTLKVELDSKVKKFTNEIVIASLIDNVNIRGRIIEYLIAGEDESLRKEIVKALQNRSIQIPRFATVNSLGDYSRIFDNFFTETDVKTKIMVLNSNPKAYNIDKMLEFLSQDKTVFMFYFIGIDPGKIVNQILVSMFQEKIVSATILLKHWAGRNSRGVTQLEGNVIHNLILSPETNIDTKKGKEFLDDIISF